MIRMKSTRSFVFLICPIMVLIFLYYSSGRLHLRSPVQKSQCDKQGFLTKLDRKLPLELQYKYGNLSKGECKPGYAEAKMTSIYPKFSKPAPMFLDSNFKRLSKISSYPPPFGVRTQEKIIDHILQATKRYSLGSELDSISCVFVRSFILAAGEAGVSRGERELCVRTRSCLQRFASVTLFILIIKRSMEGFWKSVARVVPREPEDIRILNPYFIQEAAFKFIGLPNNNGLMGRGNIPTLGTVAITMALHSCDEVAVAGFGYDMNTPHAPLHYYEKLMMSAIKESWTHNISKEKEFLRKLVKGGVIRDLTNGI
ncbi:ST3 beta-galactoside alpha-2,3-sialyltransferase 3a [Sinocyclocheilus anshuiensis]|uniref:ST3 beta-galactoside alpha-2,3-sialyltransferase 3a n=1 Tax=Sinocyclocheilus anshuiensis TaxID=1608454 RepID=UPI0007B9EEF4|nr:PREDICTED: CMP-N-acetylneuraminate-beta-1,4-galactoside alpha-2,3-sialyltransferase [Sinocyclocheilus anshuiensis]